MKEEMIRKAREREREKVATCVASFPGRPKRLSDYEKIREMKSLF